MMYVHNYGYEVVVQGSSIALGLVAA